MSKVANGDIRPVYPGEVFLRVYIWVGLLLFTLLVQKGLDAVLRHVSFSGLGAMEFRTGISGNVLYAVLIYVALFLNVLFFSFRYLIWSPWKIYNRIFDVQKYESEIDFRRAVYGLSKADRYDILHSIFFLCVEFVLCYFAADCISCVQYCFLGADPVV